MGRHGESFPPMETVPILRDLLVLVAVALPVAILAHKLRVPTLVGFLATGVLIGPHALRFIADPQSVNQLAEIGVVLLLFAVGLELSLARILRMGRYVIEGGALQVVGTMAVVGGCAALLGKLPNEAVLWGALIALSSTAIVLKIYADLGELDSSHGRMVVAILLFQDLCVVPLMLLLPLLAGTAQGPSAALRAALLTALVTAGLIVGGRVIVPRVLERVADLHNQEIFTLSVLAIGLGAAFLTAHFGLSLALGAFLAGLLVSESEYGLQALSDVLPFRDTFSGIFFTSVGMLLDLGFVAGHLLLVAGVALAIVVLKAVIAALAVRLVRRSARVAVVSGLGLAQVGEFSFVLAGVAGAMGLMSGQDFQIFLGAAVLTMLAAPFLISAAPSVAERVLAHRSHATMEFATREARALRPLKDHVIIVGYGLNGRNLARALRNAGIPYVILESNGQVVRQARLDREPIYFGDGTRSDVLERVGIGRARIIVFAIASHHDEMRGIAVARHLNPVIHIVARTRYVADMEELYAAGANEVVPEEFETSLEIFTRVLRRYQVAEHVIRAQAEEARRDHYELLRQRGRVAQRVDTLLAAPQPGLEVRSFAAAELGVRGSIPVTDWERQLRRTAEVRVVGLEREGRIRLELSPGELLLPQDRVFLIGTTSALDGLEEELRSRSESHSKKSHGKGS
jgi:CPA2 family monovalent cation:H+ antiporter-2